MTSHQILAVQFAQGTECRGLLDGGWWDLETTRIWAKGIRSTLKLPALEKVDTVLELSAGSFTHPEIRPVQRLILSCNGIEIGTFKFTHGVSPPINCLLPGDILQDDEPNTIELYHPDHVVPLEVGLTDWRDVSICLFSLSLSYGDDNSRREHIRDYLAEMVSLGDSCEFGLVQRLTGLEPLGLFRFAGIKLPDLIRAIKTRFKNMGDLENIRIESSGSNREMHVIENLYNITYHLFQAEDAVDRASECKRQSARIHFLVRKTLDELSDGERLFVWASPFAVEKAEVAELLHAIRSIGPSTLLWVVEDSSGDRAGQAEYIENGLIRCYVDRLCSPPFHVNEVSLESWKAACWSAYQLWKKHARMTASE